MNSALARLSFCAILMMSSAVAAAAQTDQSSTTTSVTEQSLPRLAATLEAMLVAQNECISYAYDANSNRTSTANAAVITTGPVWGTASYPCFIWSAN